MNLFILSFLPNYCQSTKFVMSLTNRTSSPLLNDTAHPF